MRTETITRTVYTAPELKENHPESYEKAKYKHFQFIESDFNGEFESYTIDSLDEALEDFSIVIKTVSTTEGISARKKDFYTGDLHLSVMPALRLYKWLLNNRILGQYEPKVFYKTGSSKSRKSKITKHYEPTDNYVVNNAVLSALKDFEENLRKWGKHSRYDYSDFQQDIIGHIETSLTNEVKYYCSDEYFLENSEANQYEYDENGELV